MRRTGGSMLAAALVGTLVLVGCGRPDGNQVSVGLPKRTPQAQAVAAAAAATLRLDTATFAMSSSETDQGDDGDPGDTTTKGAFDRPNHRSDVTIAFRPAGGADTEFTTGPEELSSMAAPST